MFLLVILYGYWGNWGFFCSAPQDFVVGVFCARFPPRSSSSGG